MEGFVLLQILSSIFFPFSIYGIRFLRLVVGAPGEGLGILEIFFSSLILLLPMSLLHGASFSFGCKMQSILSKEDAPSIGRIYVWETLGTIGGGFLLTYLLIPHLHSFNISILVGILNLLVCSLLIKGFAKKRILGKALCYGCIGTLALFLYIGIGESKDKIHLFSISHQWPDQRILHYKNSIYGNVTVTKTKEQLTFFYNGVPIITTPTPNRVFVEEFVHIPMLFHQDPKKILIISGGAGGVINEVLRHRVKMVDYVELDPLILKTIQDFPTPLTSKEINDPKVKIHHMDGRLFIKKVNERYDVVFVGVFSPEDLQVNRLFTTQFFSMVKERLEDGGILVIVMPGSLTYLSDELRDLNLCVMNTLKMVFPYLRVIPGDGMNIFLASTSRRILTLTSQDLVETMKKRTLKTHLITPGHLHYRLAPRWSEWFFHSIKGGTKRVNEDFSPILLYYGLSHWNAKFSPYFQRVFKWAERINVSLVLIFVLILMVGIIAFRPKRFCVPLCITTTGFSGMIFDLAIILSFQAIYGYVYQWIGILVSVFMAGVAIGGSWMTSTIKKTTRGPLFFAGFEGALCLFSLVLPLVIGGLESLQSWGSFLVKIVFLGLSFISGFLIGGEFPLAGKMHLDSSQEVGRTAGLLYTCDLAGGWIGGMVGGVMMLPLLGLFWTCVVILVVKFSSLLIFVVFSRFRNDY
jgi:spermidine synthase